MLGQKGRATCSSGGGGSMGVLDKGKTKENERNGKEAHSSQASLRPSATPSLLCERSRWHVQFKTSLPRCDGI